jgi:hypothetical protein
MSQCFRYLDTGLHNRLPWASGREHRVRWDVPAHLDVRRCQTCGFESPWIYRTRMASRAIEIAFVRPHLYANMQLVVREMVSR